MSAFRDRGELPSREELCSAAKDLGWQERILNFDNEYRPVNRCQYLVGHMGCDNQVRSNLPRRLSRAPG